jgi:hypothetical protein
VHGDLKDETVLESLNLEGVEDGGKIIGIELDLWACRKCEPDG